MINNNRIRKNTEIVMKRARSQGRKSDTVRNKINGNKEKVITSPTSLKQHLNRLEQFYSYLDNKDIKVSKFSQITPQIVDDYVQYQADKGMSKKTIQSDLTAINKVMTVTNSWTDKDKKYLKDYKNISIKESINNTYKRLTSEEWEKKYPKKYETYRGTIEVLKNTGLRANELKELNTKSFIIDTKTNELYVQTIGKGGKYRISPVLNSSDTLSYIRIEPIKRDIESMKNNLERSERDFKYALQDAKKDKSLRLNLKGSNGHHLPKHINRAYYARKLLEREIKAYESLETVYKGYTTLKEEKDNYSKYDIQVNGYKGNAQAFLNVSKAIGHNRLDVLRSYI